MAQEPTGSEAAALMISAKTAKAMANTWRARVLVEVTERPMSASKFVEEIGGELHTISRCFRQLATWGFIEVVAEMKGGRRRGGVEKVYRGIQRAHFDTRTWEELPRFLREEFSGSILSSLLRRITDAVKHGTFDAERNRHLSWKAVRFDRRAWTEYVARMDEDLDWVNELEAQSARRMSETGEEPIPATVALMAFRSPDREALYRVVDQSRESAAIATTTL